MLEKFLDLILISVAFIAIAMMVGAVVWYMWLTYLVPMGLPYIPFETTVFSLVSARAVYAFVTGNV